MLRGSIRNREQAQQLRDFTGLRYGNITPTDIDAFIEYKNKCYVIIESKYKDPKMSRGQGMALERLCDDLQKTKPTLLIIAVHECDPNQDVDYAKSVAKRIRYKGKWFDENKEVSRIVSIFLRKSDENKL